MVSLCMFYTMNSLCIFYTTNSLCMFYTTNSEAGCKWMTVRWVLLLLTHRNRFLNIIKLTLAISPVSGCDESVFNFLRGCARFSHSNLYLGWSVLKVKLCFSLFFGKLNLTHSRFEIWSLQSVVQRLYASCVLFFQISNVISSGELDKSVSPFTNVLFHFFNFPNVISGTWVCTWQISISTAPFTNMLFHFFFLTFLNFPNVISRTRICVTNQYLNASFHQNARSVSLCMKAYEDD